MKSRRLFYGTKPAGNIQNRYIKYIKRLGILMRQFEFDPVKSRSNFIKHGIDFVQAQAIWDDLNLIEFDALTSDESRSLVIGKIGTKTWAAVITYRGSFIRIISVRRARAEEVALYEI